MKITTILVASFVLVATACSVGTEGGATSADEVDVNAAKPLVWSEHTHATLSASGTDRYTFKAQAGWTVSLVVNSLDCAPNSTVKGANGAQFGCRPAWAPRVVVLNASTKEVVLDNSGPLVTGDALGETKKLRTAGTYVVLVSSAAGTPGSYDVTLSPPDISCTRASQCPDEFPRCERIGLLEEDGPGKTCVR